MASTKLTIGTDPELVLAKRGAIVRAGDVIHERDSRFGVDGHPYTAELRPDPAVNPRDLVESIRKTLASRAEQLAAYTWLAGPWALDKPLGGHIHFGVPFEERFRDALNWQFGTILALAEPEIEAKQRRTFPFYNGRPYGALGDVRSKKWGFEYRTPSSFIVSPGTVLGIMTVAKAIIWEEMNKGKAAWSSLSANQRQELQFNTKDFDNCNKVIFAPKLALVERYLKEMLYFRAEQEGHSLWPAVAYLFNHTLKNKSYRIGHDIKLKWKLGSESKEESTSKPLPPPLVTVPVQNWWRNTERAIRLHHEDQFAVPEFTGISSGTSQVAALPETGFQALQVWEWL